MADYLINFDINFTRPQKYPVHASKSGRDYGLTIVTKDLVDNFNGMCAIKDGFKITLHSPLTHPRMSTHFIDVPADDVTMIAIKPFVITTSEDLRQYHPKIRHCYFENEKKLEFFRHYSQSNCEYECYIQRLMSTCGCVVFYMPHISGTRICQSSTEKSCHCDFRENYGQLKDCDCLPSCNSVTYDTEITSSKREPTPENIEHVSVYFKKDYFLKIKRFQVFGWATFWSSIGGFLGLLMGGSVLSIFEVFYNIFIRHCFTKRHEIMDVESRDVKDEINKGNMTVKRTRSTQSCRF
ncbi:pickpocket protein 28-like [Chironomus tepperi]|uniref:pickpocket protein 28-like n=1 Tax=Chironomus tepperi TaxID=113505 RepID=UPI00391F69F9